MHKDGQLNGKTGLDVGVDDNPYYLRRRRQETAEPEAVTQKADAVSVDDGAGPAVEVKPKSERQRRLAFACALLVLLAAGGGLLYLRYGRTTTIERQIKAKPGLSAQIGQGRIEQPNNESPDQQTLDAIKQSQEARRAGGAPAQGETTPSVEPAPQVMPSMPKLQIPGDYVEPRAERRIEAAADSGESAGPPRAAYAAIAAGLGLEEAGRRRWADEYFECGEVLDAYREAARAAEAGDPPPALLIDEVEKLDAGIQHTLLQPLARGFAAAPKLKGVIGVADPMLAPVVVMTTNDLKKLGEPLRDRCILTMIEPPTPAEEVAVFRARVPQASAYLIGAAAKLLHKIRTGMDEITHKPGIRGAVLLLRAMSRHGVERVTRRTLEPYLGCLARDGEDEKNLYAALATLELAANRSHAVIDETVRLEFEKARLRLCGERRWPHERGVQRTVGLCRRRGRAARRRIFAHQRIGATDRGGRAANPDRAKQRQQSVASGARGAVCGHARRDGWRDGDDSRALARGFGACRRGGMACGHAEERDRGGAAQETGSDGDAAGGGCDRCGQRQCACDAIRRSDLSLPGCADRGRGAFFGPRQSGGAGADREVGRRHARG